MEEDLLGTPGALNSEGALETGGTGGVPGLDAWWCVLDRGVLGLDAW